MHSVRTAALVLVVVLSLSACAGAGANSSSSSGADATRTTAPEPTQTSGERERDGGSRDRSEGRSGRGAENGDGRRVESAVLALSGDDGSGYAGVCKIGDRDMELEGTVPQTLDLDLNGEPLECRIENTGPGSLKADLSVGNAHYVQQTSARGATLNFALSGEGYRSSTSSVTAVETSTPDAVSNASSRVVAGPQDEQP